MRAVYCKCKNKYSIDCKGDDCGAPKYWKQGIGSITRIYSFLSTEDNFLILQEDNNKIII